MMKRNVWMACVLAAIPFPSAFAGVPPAAALDAEVARAMAATHAKGLAIAVIDDGRDMKFWQHD